MLPNLKHLLLNINISTIKMITWNELTSSVSARRNKIDNMPTDKLVVKNLHELLDILNLVRAEYGKPIRVTSGYRSASLNKLVGGVPTSAHLYGLAADVVPFERNKADFLAIQKLFIKFATDKGYNPIVLIEKPRNGVPTWLHLEISKSKPSKVVVIK